MNQQRTTVVALGGNALQKQGEASSQAQQRVADETIAQLLPLIQAGHRVAIVHGNGPQVGNIVLHEEAINTEAVPSLPLEDSGAMSQGLIGFWLQQAIHDALATRGVHDKYAVSIVTQTVVDQADPAFQNPTKPIGPFYSEEEAKKVQAERGYTVAGGALCRHRSLRKLSRLPLSRRWLMPACWWSRLVAAASRCCVMHRAN